MTAPTLTDAQVHLLRHLAPRHRLWANLGAWGGCARALEERGLVERFALGALKQKTALRLTDAGRAALDAASKPKD